MKLKKEEVEYVARLARLAIGEGEKKTFSRQLSDILTYVAKLNELDTENVEPTSHVLDLSNVLRDDIIHEGLSPEDALGNAPDSVDKVFRVPKIIEERQ